MVPRAEIAHWLAGSAVLLLGLVLLSEVIVGTEVFRRRRWRAYLWPSLALAGGVLLWLIVAFSTFSTMHLVAHAVWAQVAMVAGAVQLAIVRGKLASPRWPLVISVGSSALRYRVRPARAERLALLARGVPPPRPRVDAHRGGDLPAGAGLLAQKGVLPGGLRAHVRGRRRPALRRSRRRSDLRPPLGHRRRPVRRALVVAAAVVAALVVPATAGAHATLTAASPATQSRVSSTPTEVRLRFTRK